MQAFVIRLHGSLSPWGEGQGEGAHAVPTPKLNRSLTAPA